MAVLSLNTETPAAVGVFPRSVKMVTTDNEGTVEVAGYMNRQGQVLQGFTLYPTDIISAIVSYNAATNSGTFKMFTTAIAASGQITLTSWPT